MDQKPCVFVITPFNEDLLALFEEFKRVFGDKYQFTNAGDLDNQQSILKDIVVGIQSADVVIADLTGLNANVFYELGLAHAMNKKVIIITQDIDELPFDIKSYRAIEYSLQFNKLPKLITELTKLLAGAIDGTTQFGNPVSDYLPNFFNLEEVASTEASNPVEISSPEKPFDNETNGVLEGGFIDFISDIEENASNMTKEIAAMSADLQEVNIAVTSATNEINQVKSQSGTADASFMRNICRKVATPTDLFATQMKAHNSQILIYWGIIENSFLALLDNQFIKSKKDTAGIKNAIISLVDMQNEIHSTDTKIEGFISVLRGNLGMERRLNKAITSLTKELEAYLSITNTMSSSVDRIVSKGDIVLAEPRQST